MYQKLSFTDVLATIIQKIESNTDLRCYDSMPKDASGIFYHAEMLGSVPEKSKTMMKDRYQAVIHAYAPGNGSTAIFGAIHKLEEALTEDIELPDGYEMILQVPNGVSQILNEDDGTKHAIMGYDFVVFSGYKIKI